MRKEENLSNKSREGVPGVESDEELESRTGITSDGGYKSELEMGGDTMESSSLVGTTMEMMEGSEKRNGDAMTKMSPTFIFMLSSRCISTSAMLN